VEGDMMNKVWILDVLKNILIQIPNKFPEQWNQVYPSRAAEMLENGEGVDCVIEVVQMQQQQQENENENDATKRRQRGKSEQQHADQSLFQFY
jgi:hypothetical protein